MLNGGQAPTQLFQNIHILLKNYIVLKCEVIENIRLKVIRV